MMDFCIDGAQLRKALAEIESAEKNGFDHCLAVFSMTAVGETISDVRASYSDLLERGHPTDARLNWGRFQLVSKRNKLIGGELVPITKPCA